MHQKEQKTSSERNFNQVTLSESKLDEAKPETLTPLSGGMLWVSLAFVLGWIVFLLRVLGMRMVVQKEMDELLVSVDKVPCKSCRFFSNNHYINCAVHPSIVLTKQARNCPDYRSQKGKFFWQRTSQK
jgi:hypothetical protein